MATVGALEVSQIMPRHFHVRNNSTYPEVARRKVQQAPRSQDLRNNSNQPKAHGKWQQNIHRLCLFVCHNPGILDQIPGGGGGDCRITPRPHTQLFGGARPPPPPGNRPPRRPSQNPPQGASGRQLVGGVVGVQNRGVPPPGDQIWRWHLRSDAKPHQLSHVPNFPPSGMSAVCVSPIGYRRVLVL